VVEHLAHMGAVVVQADVIARKVTDEPGPARAAIIGHFGSDVLRADGALDRSALARRVFSEPSERMVLESIVHPIVHERILAELEAHRSSDDIVVLELPLLVETGGRERYGLDGVLVVDVPDTIAVERLVVGRQMDVADARARIAAQADRFERLRAADYVIMNLGDETELGAMAEEAWRWMQGLTNRL